MSKGLKILLISLFIVITLLVMAVFLFIKKPNQENYKPTLIENSRIAIQGQIEAINPSTIKIVSSEGGNLNDANSDIDFNIFVDDNTKISKVVNKIKDKKIFDEEYKNFLIEVENMQKTNQDTSAMIAPSWMEKDIIKSSDLVVGDMVEIIAKVKNDNYYAEEIVINNLIKNNTIADSSDNTDINSYEFSLSGEIQEVGENYVILQDDGDINKNNKKVILDKNTVVEVKKTKDNLIIASEYEKYLQKIDELKASGGNIYEIMPPDTFIIFQKDINYLKLGLKIYLSGICNDQANCLAQEINILE